MHGPREEDEALPHAEVVQQGPLPPLQERASPRASAVLADPIVGAPQGPVDAHEEHEVVPSAARVMPTPADALTARSAAPSAPAAA